MCEEQTYKVMLVGDVVGAPGRQILEEELAKLQWDKNIDFTIVNGENTNGGRGMNGKGFHFYKDLGVDVVTMGNHTWDNRELQNFIDKEPTILRPWNYNKSTPGRGYTIVETKNFKIGVINLIGRVGMNNVVANCPFEAALEAIEEIKKVTPIIVVDMHCETTSEKIAMGRFLDGRVTAVLGTHTHVQTNDARIFPRGTAYVTDTGMTGPRDSILGMEIDQIVNKFLDGMPTRFQVARGALQMNAVIVEFTLDGKAVGMEMVNFEKE